MRLHPLPALRTWPVRLAALLFGLVEWAALSLSRSRETLAPLHAKFTTAQLRMKRRR